MNDLEQRKAAQAFANYWKGKGKEDEDDYPFWAQLLQDVFDVEEVTKYIKKQKNLRGNRFTPLQGRNPFAIFALDMAPVSS